MDVTCYYILDRAINEIGLPDFPYKLHKKSHINFLK